MGDGFEATYARSGVDESTEQSTFRRLMLPWLKQTHTSDQSVSRIDGLDSGFFATLVHLASGPVLALTTDGVGTKLIISRMLANYESAGVDCVANNVNDLLCVGAVPLVLLDYIATERVDDRTFEQIAKGLYAGATEAGISIPGGEIAQVGDMLAREAGAGPSLDLVGSALGILPSRPDGRYEALDGSAVEPGDVILGLRSSGLHSNGFSLVRHALFEVSSSNLDERLSGTHTLGDELLRPTRIYAKTVRALRDRGVTLHGMVNISGGGLLNLGRLAANVSYIVDGEPVPQAIFGLVQDRGQISTATMYSTFNMGIGFSIVVPSREIEDALHALTEASEDPVVLGRVVAQPGKRVHMPNLGLVGEGDEFHPVASGWLA